MFREIEVTEARNDGFTPDYEMVLGIENNELFNIDPEWNDIDWIKVQLSIPYNSVQIRRRESYEDLAAEHGWEYVENSIRREDADRRKVSKWDWYWGGGGIYGLTDMISKCFVAQNRERMTFEEIYNGMEILFKHTLEDPDIEARLMNILDNDNTFIKTELQDGNDVCDGEYWFLSAAYKNGNPNHMTTKGLNSAPKGSREAYGNKGQGVINVQLLAQKGNIFDHILSKHAMKTKEVKEDNLYANQLAKYDPRIMQSTNKRGTRDLTFLRREYIRKEFLNLEEHLYNEFMRKLSLAISISRRFNLIRLEFLFLKGAIEEISEDISELCDSNVDFKNERKKE